MYFKIGKSNMIKLINLKYTYYMADLQSPNSFAYYQRKNVLRK